MHPIRRWTLPSRAVSVPVLMYHSVSDQESGGRHPYFETTTAPLVFAEQMRFLKRAGYRTVTLQEAVQYMESGRQTSKPPVALTFDDGFQDFYTHAFPILEEHQFTATVFLPTNYIAEERRQFKKWHCMTWREVRAMHACGITFGSHTATHRQLSCLTAAQVEDEVRRSKETIENHLGHSVKSFSYPFAFPQADHAFKRMLRSKLTAQGYQTGVTTIIGTCSIRSDPFFLPRLPVNSWDDLRLLQAKLAGAYDWLHGAQYLFGAITSHLSGSAMQRSSETHERTSSHG